MSRNLRNLIIGILLATSCIDIYRLQSLRMSVILFTGGLGLGLGLVIDAKTKCKLALRVRSHLTTVMSFFCHHVRTVTLVTMQPISDDMLTMSTRMHSSRMHTAPLVAQISQHALLPGGVPAQGVVYLPRGWCTCPGGVPAQEEVYLAEGVSVQGGVPALVVYLPRGVYLPWGCTCLGGVPAPSTPPVNRILDTCY